MIGSEPACTSLRSKSPRRSPPALCRFCSNPQKQLRHHDNFKTAILPNSVGFRLLRAILLRARGSIACSIQAASQQLWLLWVFSPPSISAFTHYQSTIARAYCTFEVAGTHHLPAELTFPTATNSTISLPPISHNHFNPSHHPPPLTKIMVLSTRLKKNSTNNNPPATMPSASMEGIIDIKTLANIYYYLSQSSLADDLALAAWVKEHYLYEPINIEGRDIRTAEGFYNLERAYRRVRSLTVTLIDVRSA